MAKKKSKNTLPSGSKRLQVYVGMVDVLDANGNPVLDENGKVKKKRKYESITAPTIEEAKALKIQVQEAYKVNPNEMTIRDAIDAYIASIRVVESPKTIEGYETIRDYGFQSIMGVNIKRLDNSLLQKAINEECSRPSKSHRSKGKTISAKTVQNEWGLIAAVIKKYNPQFKINITLPSHVSPVHELSSPKTIFDMVKGTDIELPVLLAMWLSFTMSEIKGLKKSTSIKGDYLYIDNVMLDTKNGDFEKSVGKNTKRNRMHRIPPYIKQLIDNVESDALVTMSGKSVYYRFVKLLKQNNLPHMSFHDLRHVNASVMSFLSIPTEYAMDRGGWSSPKIMQGTYMQIYNSERIKVDNTMDRYFENEVLLEKKIDEKYNAWLTLFDRTDCEESRNEYQKFTNASRNATRTKKNP